jgi:hypothetical protein
MTGGGTGNGEAGLRAELSSKEEGSSAMTLLSDALTAAASRAAADEAFRLRLLDDAVEALRSNGYTVNPAVTVSAVLDEGCAIKFRISFGNCPV